MKTLRLISSILLMLSLTLPLSTCSTTEQGNGQTTTQNTERYLISSENSASQWIWIATFILPFVFAIATYKKKPTLFGEIVAVILCSPPVLVLWWHSGTGSLASGGYVATIAIGIFSISALVNLVQVLNQNRLATQNDARQL